MPELPEVECIVKILKNILIGEKIQKTIVKTGQIINGKSNKRSSSELLTKEFITALKNKTITNIFRIGKNIVIQINSSQSLIFHLKMTGQVLIKAKDELDNILKDKHSHIIFELSKQILVYRDIRKFGYVNLVANNELPDFKAIDPLNLKSVENLQSFFNSKIGIKKLFLDQKFILGIGNIYSDEILFRSKIHPSQAPNLLSESEKNTLLESIKVVIYDSINFGGSSISDYLLPDGSKGNYAKYHKIYGKHGKNCPNCNVIISKTKINGRTTSFCSFCQTIKLENK
jgi:formamidopyrimidine-DNA glycosylase